jgi:hypothetical protein
MENSRSMKRELLQKLKNEHVFWSYNPVEITAEIVSDEIIIEKTLTYLDIEDIDLLFHYYKPQYIKKVWRNNMAHQGDYLYSLNRFIAWYYFKITNPDKYLKRIENKKFKSYD